MRYRLVVVLLMGCHMYSVDSQCPRCPQADSKLDDDWEQFKSKFGKKYSCTVNCQRRGYWEINWKKIDAAKSDPSYAKSTFQINPNEFADWSKEENQRRFGLRRPSIASSNTPSSTGPPILRGPPPTDLNYTALGIVTSVKNQGGCGNCWAFSAAGAIEGQLAKILGWLPDVSVQEVTDCCKSGSKYSCYGCDGGWMNGAFTCTKDIGGIVESKYYGFQGKDQPCLASVGNYTRFKCQSYFAIKAYDEAAIMDHLISVGPLSTAFDASKTSFQYYQGGIYNDQTCPRNANHAMLITGCGTTEDGVNYWILKNSWGTGWGEGGYIRIQRDLNLCDLAHYCSYPTGCTVV